MISAANIVITEITTTWRRPRSGALTGRSGASRFRHIPAATDRRRSKLNISVWNIEDDLFADPPSVNATQRLFESPTSRFAAVLYHVIECRMGADIARLAVFEDKSFPRLILKQPEIWWDATPLAAAVRWLSEATFAIVTAGKREMPIVVVELACRRFCFIHIPRGDTCTIQLCDEVLSLSEAGGDHAPGKTRNRPYAELHWFSFDRFADFFAAYDESARLHGIPGTPIRQRIRAAAATCMELVLFLLLSVPLRAIDWLRRLVMSRISRS